MDKVKISGKLNLITGLHIGGNDNSNSIGGIDSSVIKTLRNNKLEPYIPGSSLKGKIRSLLEQSEGVNLGGCQEINSLFGYSAEDKRSKIVFYDAYLTKGSRKRLEESEHLDMLFTEEKVENSIDRVSGKSKRGLRHIERVPNSTSFNFQVIVTVDNPEDDKYIELLKKGMRLLELDYLGGNGTRGYGQVEFSDLQSLTYTVDDRVKEGEHVDFSIKD